MHFAIIQSVKLVVPHSTHSYNSQAERTKTYFINLN